MDVSEGSSESCITYATLIMSHSHNLFVNCVISDVILKKKIRFQFYWRHPVNITVAKAPTIRSNFLCKDPVLEALYTIFCLFATVPKALLFLVSNRILFILMTAIICVPLCMTICLQCFRVLISFEMTLSAIVRKKKWFCVFLMFHLKTESLVWFFSLMSVHLKENLSRLEKVMSV